MKTILVKLFIYNDNYYLYDTCKNMLLRISKKHFVIINDLLQNETNFDFIQNDSKESVEISMLYRRGFFQSNLIDRIENPHSDYIEGLLSGGMNDLVLQVTQKCNFNCRYCLYSGKEEIERTHTNTNMNRDVALKEFDYLEKNS